MPRSVEETLNDDVLYPDDLDDQVNMTFAEDPFENVYTAEEVREELGTEQPEYGDWIKVDLMMDQDKPAFAAAPSQLRKLIRDARPEKGDLLQVNSVERGPKQHDPYEMDMKLNPEHL